MSVPPPLPPPLPPEEPPRRPTSLIVLLAIPGAAIVGFVIWLTIPAPDDSLTVHAPAAASVAAGPHATPVPRQSLDTDKLVSEYPGDQDYFHQLDAATLAEYDRTNPADKPWYADGRKAVRLFAAFAVWNDFHGQGVLPVSDGLAAVAYKKGCHDPLVCSICDVLTYESRFSSKRKGAQDHMQRTRDLDASRYPALLKFLATDLQLKDLTYEKDNPDELDESLADLWGELPKFVTMLGTEFSAMLKENVPTDVLFLRAGKLFGHLQDSDYLLPVGNEVEKAFTSQAPDHPGRAALRGYFLKTWAWQARGSGWASTVTEEGSRLMAERLDEANHILTAAYEKNPDDYLSATIMIAVELGQGEGRDTMEKWYDRAMEGHPDNFQAAYSKMWYLQPRWYGSPYDVIKFGQECVKSGNWKAKIPLVLTNGIGDIADQQKDLYRHDEVWKLVAPVYEEYLKHYPDSTVVRTVYADCASHGGRLDILRKQLAILGPNWDRDRWSNEDYHRIAQLSR